MGDLARSAMAGGLTGGLTGGLPMAALTGLASMLDTAKEQMYGRDPKMDMVTLAEVGSRGKVPPVNPYASKAQTARQAYELAIKPTTQEAAMAEAFPVGGGFGRAGAAGRVDASIDRAVKAEALRKEAEVLEARSKAWNREQAVTPKREAVQAFLAEKISFGGKKVSRRQIMMDLQAKGVPQEAIKDQIGWNEFKSSIE